MMFGSRPHPPRVTEGLGLCFVGTWTLEEKAVVLMDHLGVGIEAARRLAQLNDAK